jgi:hypothetical protein
VNLVRLRKHVDSLEVLSITSEQVIVRLANGTTRTLMLGDIVDISDNVGVAALSCPCEGCQVASDAIVGVLMSVGFVREEVGRAH